MRFSSTIPLNGGKWLKNDSFLPTFVTLNGVVSFTNLTQLQILLIPTTCFQPSNSGSRLHHRSRENRLHLIIYCDVISKWKKKQNLQTQQKLEMTFFFFTYIFPSYIISQYTGGSFQTLWMFFVSFSHASQLIWFDF